jgi:hypothetical protein
MAQVKENRPIPNIERYARLDNLTYDPPNYQQTDNAYAVIIFLGNSFLAGVLATCYSIIKYDTSGNDIVVMVTSKQGINQTALTEKEKKDPR